MKYRNRILLLLLLCIQFIVPVKADSALRPRHIDIEVKNAPQEEYYLDLLVDDGETLLFRDLYIKDYDKEMIAKLESMVPEEMHTILWGGSHQRLRGSLVGKQKSNNTMLHSLDGHGVPSRFRVVTVTKSGEKKMSDWYEYDIYIGKIFMDYSTMTITQRPYSLFYVCHYIQLVIPYLLVKMLWYKYGKVLNNRKRVFGFLATCVIEIGLISGIMSSAMIYNGSLGQAAMVLMFAEMIYTFVEYLFLAYPLKVPTLKAAAISFGSNMTASVALILLLQYLFLIFVF